MTINDLKEQNLILLECISGSKAYGLDTPQSDTDIKGVFYLPKDKFFGFDYIPQISNETNDEVYYEVGRFFELLSVNNPNILELLNTPEKCILHKDPLLDNLDPNMFLSKLCKNTFGRFAMSQIKKAKGLKKKIVNPVDKERKGVIKFCQVNYENGSIPLEKYLELKGWNQEYCGLTNIPSMKNMYGLYYNENLNYKGVFQKTEANEVSLSSIPKGEKQEALVYFNKDGYSTYCKEYREYWDWVEKRNNDRYENTKSHGKNYDAKNMMHTFRLLDMAIEIGKEGRVNVNRPNREFLLEIKSGNFEYDELLQLANDKQNEMEIVFESSLLPETPNLNVIEGLLIEIRERLYA